MRFRFISKNACSGPLLRAAAVFALLITIGGCCRRDPNAALDPIGFIPEPTGAIGASPEAPLPPAAPLSLSPGARPVVLQVSKATPQLVARSVVTWGYNDTAGRFITAGSGTFDHRGGVLTGEIKADTPVDAVQMVLAVDYANPQLSDLTWRLQEPVTSAGVNHIFDVTSARLHTLVLLDIPLCGIDEQDYLFFAWRFQSGGASSYLHSGVLRLQYADLQRARGLLIRRQFDLPLRQHGEGQLQWSITGTLRKHPVRRAEGSFSSNTASLRLSFSDEGSVLVR